MSILDPRQSTSSSKTSDQTSQGLSNIGDSSGPLFSIYYKAADEEDNKMAKRWQKDADGILIFVRPCVCIDIFSRMNRNTIDWSILRLTRCSPCCYGPGPEARLSVHLRTLPWQHLSGSRRPERNTPIYSFPTPIHSSCICCLGEFTLVLEPGYGPQLCSVGDIFAAVGTSISQYGPTCTVQSRETSADACVLCQRRKEDACPMGS